MARKSPERTTTEQSENLRQKKEEQKLNAPKVEPNQRSSNRKSNGSDGSPGTARGSNH
ncbi:MAG TPA: hypothetical protein VM935_19720 [Chitinophagaceae bacterium]|jgi:hypothetical protein|nr:hypothetical protein [Chitinophagaceae bacterium]